MAVILAEYFTTIDNTLLFIIREDFEEPFVKTIAVTANEIRQFATDYFGTLQGGTNKMRNLNPSEWQRRFGQLIEPLAAYTEKDDIIWFVPHDALHYFPLHALQIEGKYLIERNPVCYTSSASVMKFCRAKRKNRRKSALVIGDSRGDLPYSREEAVAVAKLFNTTPYLQHQATKSLVKQKLAHERDQLDILHFSCHGYFRLQQALKSGIMLAPEAYETDTKAHDDEQWNLTAEEILVMSINADLVTLSACETGVNEQKPGDELIGLTRALIYAGTPSVIVSLWAVNDLSTSLLMQRFYQELRKMPQEDDEGLMTKARALQLAQCFVRNLTAQDVRDYEEMNRTFILLDPHLPQQSDINDQKHPFEDIYFWAPFILIGDWK